MGTGKRKEYYTRTKEE